MRTGLPGAYYVGDEQYERELAAFNGGVWVAVCMADEVASPNDFVVREVFGRQVVVQNIGGQVKAFLNVCPHRFNRVQTAPIGNRPLVCGYHGWEFDCDGAPCRIPKRPSFEGLEPAQHSLVQYDVEVCGKLVFACRQKVVDLRAWLGDAWSQIEGMTNACGRRLDANAMLLLCNWKIAVENTLEAYHVGHIHPETFHRLGANGGEFAFQGPHSLWKAPLSPKTSERLAAMDDILSARQYKPAGYEHQLVFPNCTIASAAGMSVAVQFFMPIGLGATSFLSLVYEADVGEIDDSSAQRRELFNQSVVQFNRKVFLEDSVVCESTHSGAREAGEDVVSVLSDDEERVVHHIMAVLEACDR